MLIRATPLHGTLNNQDMSMISVLNPFFETIDENIKTLVPDLTYYVADRGTDSYDRWESRAVTAKIFTLSGWHLRNLPLYNPSNSSYCPGWNSETFQSPPPALDATMLWNVLKNEGQGTLYSSFTTTYRNRFTAGYTSVVYYGFVGTSSQPNYVTYNIAPYGMPSGTIFPCIAPYGNQIKVADDGTAYIGPLPPNGFVRTPQQAMQGQPVTIQWQSVSDATSYTLERSTNGGSSYTQVYTGANTTFTETVGSDWTQLQYRVKAINADGESPYTVSPAIEVVSSQVLAISGTDGDLGTLTADIHYTVSSNTGNQINLSRYVNGIQVASLTVDSGFSYDIPVLELPTGENQSIQIQASVNTTGGSPVSASRNWTYDKANIEFPDDAGIGVLSQNGDNVYPATVMEAIRTYGFMGGTLDKTLLELANSGQVLTGSYVGTGQYGASNPNTIEMSRSPKLFVIGVVNNYTYAIWTDGMTLMSSISGSASWTNNVLINENGISWYNTGNAINQFNYSGTTYNWVAIC